MKKGLTLLMFLFILTGSTTLIHADMGPKPEIKITVDHAPTELYYLDLLVKESFLGEINPEKTYDHPEMIEKLKAYEAEGWIPALGSARAFMWGELTGSMIEGKMVHIFSYHVPDEFRIILVTQSGKVMVSDPIQRDTFYFTMHFDAQSGKITVPNVAIQYAVQFTTTFIPTLIVEFMVLLTFGLYSKRNLIVFLIMNLITQIFLTFTVNMALIQMGLLSAIVFFIFLEGFIWIFEMIVCWKFFDKKRSTGRRIAYALVANILSFILGIFLLMVQFSWL